MARYITCIRFVQAFIQCPRNLNVAIIIGVAAIHRLGIVIVHFTSTLALKCLLFQNTYMYCITNKLLNERDVRALRHSGSEQSLSLCNLENMSCHGEAFLSVWYV